VKYFQTDIDGGLAVVTLSHGKANALDVEFCDAVADEFNRLRETARAVVLTSSGKIFCAGVDLKRLADEGPEYTHRFLPALDKLLLSLFEFPKPLVSAINGHAIAGGCIVACTGDYRIMAEGPFKIGVPELHVGVPFPPSALEVLRFAAPDRYVQELTSGEKIYSPELAANHGLVHRTTAAEQLLQAALAEAGRLSDLQPQAFTLTKMMLRKPIVDRIEQLNMQFAERILAGWTHPETREAIRRYVEATLKR
jgi:enoyl-CoA hydratase